MSHFEMLPRFMPVIVWVDCGLLSHIPLISPPRSSLRTHIFNFIISIRNWIVNYPFCSRNRVYYLSIDHFFLWYHCPPYTSALQSKHLIILPVSPCIVPSNTSVFLLSDRQDGHRGFVISFILMRPHILSFSFSGNSSGRSLEVISPRQIVFYGHIGHNSVVLIWDNRGSHRRMYTLCIQYLDILQSSLVLWSYYFPRFKATYRMLQSIAKSLLIVLAYWNCDIFNRLDT